MGWIMVRVGWIMVRVGWIMVRVGWIMVRVGWIMVRVRTVTGLPTESANADISPHLARCSKTL
jgi:hypothetical protein